MSDETQALPGQYRGTELAIYPYLECGALGHSWDFVGGNPRRGPVPFGDPVTLRCMRCGMERWDLVQRESRQLLSRKYVQPEGYKFARGERPKRIDFLLMSIDETRRKRVTKRTSITSTVANGGPANQPTKTSNHKRKEASA